LITGDGSFFFSPPVAVIGFQVLRLGLSLDWPAPQKTPPSDGTKDLPSPHVFQILTRPAQVVPGVDVLLLSSPHTIPPLSPFQRSPLSDSMLLLFMIFGSPKNLSLFFLSSDPLPVQKVSRSSGKVSFKKSSPLKALTLSLSFLKGEPLQGRKGGPPPSRGPTKDPCWEDPPNGKLSSQADNKGADPFPLIWKEGRVNKGSLLQHADCIQKKFQSKALSFFILQRLTGRTLFREGKTKHGTPA